LFDAQLIFYGSLAIILTIINFAIEYKRRKRVRIRGGYLQSNVLLDVQVVHQLSQVGFTSWNALSDDIKKLKVCKEEDRFCILRGITVDERKNPIFEIELAYKHGV